MNRQNSTVQELLPLMLFVMTVSRNTGIYFANVFQDEIKKKNRLEAYLKDHFIVVDLLNCLNEYFKTLFNQDQDLLIMGKRRDLTASSYEHCSALLPIG